MAWRGGSCSANGRWARDDSPVGWAFQEDCVKVRLRAHEALGRGILLERGRVTRDSPVRDVIDDERMVRPAALAVAIALGLPPGEDRREEVARALQRR